MKLREISADTVRRSVEIFLQHAYPGSSRWRAPGVDLSGGETARDLISKFDDESGSEAEEGAARYVLRLGNDRYPHMKLVLEENILAGQFVFGVDTHDDLKIPTDAPDHQRWVQLREYNVRLKEQIERAWRESAIPTLADLKAMLGSVERISREARTVLVVDDDPTIRDTIRTLLERAGLRVRTATHGGEALEQVAEEAPDLILMDFQMPRMDGVTACEALKKNPGTQRIPVLLATASQVDLRTLTYADGFLVKPYRQDILFSLVRKLLG
ncbi:MAG: response regulator [Planctomycetota bacterium]